MPAPGSGAPLWAAGGEGLKGLDGMDGLDGLGGYPGEVVCSERPAPWAAPSGGGLPRACSFEGGLRGRVDGLLRGRLAWVSVCPEGGLSPGSREVVCPGAPRGGLSRGESPRGGLSRGSPQGVACRRKLSEGWPVLGESPEGRSVSGTAPGHGLSQELAPGAACPESVPRGAASVGASPGGFCPGAAFPGRPPLGDLPGRRSPRSAPEGAGCLGAARPGAVPWAPREAFRGPRGNPPQGRSGAHPVSGSRQCRKRSGVSCGRWLTWWREASEGSSDGRAERCTTACRHPYRTLL